MSTASQKRHGLLTRFNELFLSTLVDLLAIILAVVVFFSAVAAVIAGIYYGNRVVKQRSEAPVTEQALPSSPTELVTATPPAELPKSNPAKTPKKAHASNQKAPLAAPPDRITVVYFATTRAKDELRQRSNGDASSIDGAQPSSIIYGKASVATKNLRAFCTSLDVPADEIRIPQSEVTDVVLLPSLDALVADAKSTYGATTLREFGFAVYVHGFGTTFEQSLGVTAQISAATCRMGPTIVFSWPSRGGSTSALDIVFGRLGETIAAIITEGDIFDILDFDNARSGKENFTKVSTLVDNAVKVASGCGDEIGLIAARAARSGLGTAKAVLPQLDPAVQRSAERQDATRSPRRVSVPLSISEPRSMCQILSYQTIDGQCFEKYCAERDRARAAAPQLRAMLAELRSLLAHEKAHIVLVAHSMGNYLVSATMDGDSLVQAESVAAGTLVSRLISIAPDMSGEEYKKIIGNKSFSSEVILYQSPFDVALIISSLINGSMRVGLGGPLYGSNDTGDEVRILWDNNVMHHERSDGVWLVQGDGNKLFDFFEAIDWDPMLQNQSVASMSDIALTIFHGYHLVDQNMQISLGYLIRRPVVDTGGVLAKTFSGDRSAWGLQDR